MSHKCGNVPCRHIVITNNSCDEFVTITQPLIGTVEVTAVGPQGPKGRGTDPGNTPTNVYLTPTSITCEADVNIDLSESAYASSGMFELSWNGGAGNMSLTLPDCTISNNINRAIRFISDSTYSTNTRTYLTPSSGQTIDGSTNYYEINKEYEGIMLWSDGAEWFIIQKKA
jgi:hypothetical protein